MTGVIDANMIYGNDDKLAASLRTFEGGELRFQLSDNGEEFPPNSLNPNVDCTNPPSEKVCYFAGKFWAELLKQHMLLLVAFLNLPIICCQSSRISTQISLAFSSIF